MCVLDMVTIAGSLLTPKPGSYIFSVDSPVHRPLLEYVASDVSQGELHLKQYMAETMWDTPRVLETLQQDIMADFESARGILEKAPNVLEDYSIDIVRALVDKINDNVGNWFVFNIATNAQDESSIVYLILEVVGNGRFVVTKLNACGGRNSQIILARIRLMSPDYEQYMCKTRH